MASWLEKRAEFQKRFDELSQTNVQGLITELNTAVGNFIAHGGLSQDPNNNPDYQTIQTLTTKAETIKHKYYSSKNNKIIQFVYKIAA